MTKGNQNRDELIQSLQERLRWYMSEASEEEFDADEVEAIGRLLEAMDGDNWEKPDAEAAYERFQAYCRERELEEKAGRYAFEAGTDSTEEFSEELAPEKAAGSLESGRAKRAARETEAGRALATEDISSRTDAVGTEVPAETDAVGTEIPAETGKRRKSGKNRVLRRTWAAVAAALCLMFLGVGGVSMALNDGGWFLKLGDRDDGEELLVVPSEEPIEISYDSVSYNGYDDLPAEYQYLIDNIDTEKYGLKLELVEVTTGVELTKITVYFDGEKDKKLILVCNIFSEERVALQRKSYWPLEFCYEREKDGVVYSYYKEYTNDKEPNYLITFNIENAIYYIMGNLSIDDVELICYHFVENI